MPELSPQAQAVLDALFMAELNGPQQLMARAHAAAALRAAADQLVLVQWDGRIEPDALHSLGVNFSRDALHALANELEAT
ncbi:hypothetical protein CPKG_00014 [Cyanophage KBS-S-2A]|uniref:hypothetical protein n=1 Tax=Cyanophage KBS-S-2A TaxID=889953 RepID=UPI0002C18A85|nr:hypothetical protein CPKG_00014 [Cyanophage KBS-S-2A]AGH57645.1 hypothetical protein CPKG_00014 [Cyanophage KBS-S-2A]